MPSTAPTVSASGFSWLTTRTWRAERQPREHRLGHGVAGKGGEIDGGRHPRFVFGGRARPLGGPTSPGPDPRGVRGGGHGRRSAARR